MGNGALIQHMKIVFVNDAVDIAENVRQRDFRLIQNRRITFVLIQLRLRVRVYVLAADELVEVTVGPANRYLQHGVKPRQVGGSGDMQTPPDARLTSLQEDF